MTTAACKKSLARYLKAAARRQAAYTADVAHHTKRTAAALRKAYVAERIADDTYFGDARKAAALQE